MNRAFAKNPRLRELYELYLVMRSTQLVIYEKPVGRDGAKTKIIPVVWPSSLNLLPRVGGIYDQDYVELRILFAFFKGDQAGTNKYMTRA